MRIFTITGGAVALKNLTLKGADAPFGDGGAVTAIGDVSLTLDAVTVRDNATREGRGGGLFFQTSATEHLPASPAPPRLAIRDSLFQNNVADDGGGANVDLGQHGANTIHVQAVGQRAEITRTQFLGNTAQDRGGGLATWQGAGAEVQLVESTISGNVAGTLRTHGTNPGELRDSGGGVYSYLFSGDDPVSGGDPNDLDNGIAKLVITGSTVDNNVSGSFGGGLAVCAKRQDPDLTARSQVAIVNSTMSTNLVLRNGTEPRGGGELGKGGGVALAIFPDDFDEGLDVHFQNATIAKNRALDGGGVWSMVPSRPDGVVRTWLTNTIVSSNTKIDVTVPNNLSGSFDVAATRFNLVGSGNTIFHHATHAPSAISAAVADGNSLNNDAPGLNDLNGNGGPTRTHALTGSSLAIDRGSNALATVPFTAAALTTDQRGASFQRIVDTPGKGPLGQQVVDIGAYELNHPKVLDVTIRKTGANQTLNPDHHFARNNVFGPNVGSGRQLQTVPVGGADAIEVKFSEDVTIVPGDMAVTGIRFGTTLTPHATDQFSYDTVTHTARWRYQLPAGSPNPAIAPVMPDDHYLLAVQQTIVGAASGLALDGEWVNPGRRYTTWPVDYTNPLISKFPSGDGVAGGAFQFIFTLLPGDATLDNVVDNLDLSIYNQYFQIANQTFTHADFSGDGFVREKADGTFLFGVYSNMGVDLRRVYQADFNGDGQVNGLDLAIWQANQGATGSNIHALGDADLDGDVDSADLSLWQKQVNLFIVGF